MYGDPMIIILVLWPMLAALAAYPVGMKTGRGRDILAGIVPLAELALMVYACVRVSGGGTLYLDIDGICGMGIHLMLDGFRCVYGLIASIMWSSACVFSAEYMSHSGHKDRLSAFMLVTLGATMGVFLSADLFTAFIFFEIMSFTSFVWVAHDETPEAMRAAYTYLAVAVIGGLVTLMGLFILYNIAGTLTLSEIPGVVRTIRSTWPEPYIAPYGGVVTPAKLYVTGGLIAFGFAVKAGVWPLHIWLPKAHPVAPAPTSALLSGILTKTGIFGVAAVTCNMFSQDAGWGSVMLFLGVITMFTGAFLALFSINLKRTLACSSVSQIGFIMTGIGMYGLGGALNAASGTTEGTSSAVSETVLLAARGTILHMVNHSLIKLILFLAAGVVYMNLHRLDLNEIRGWGRRKPLPAVCFAAGAASISGIPGTSGYISKTLLHEAIAASGNKAAEWIFLITGGMTLCYMLKLFVAVFVEKNNDPALQAEYDANTSYWNTGSRLAVAVPALILLTLGAFPKLTMDRAASASAQFMGIAAQEMSSLDIRYYSLENLKGSLISVTIGLCLYVYMTGVKLLKADPGSFWAKHHPFMRAEYCTGPDEDLRSTTPEPTVLMQIPETGEYRTVYVNTWPAWLDLEDMIYRPLILKILPGIAGFVSALASQITDAVIIILRRTIHRQISTHVDTGSLDDHLAVEAGSLMDKYLPNKDGSSHIPALVEKEERAARTHRVISSSLSFGLILVCLGLIAVLIYTLAAS